MSKRETEVYRCDICKKEYIPNNQGDNLDWEELYGKSCKQFLANTIPQDTIFNPLTINKIRFVLPEVKVAPITYEEGFFTINTATIAHHVCKDCFTEEMQKDYDSLIEQAQNFNNKYFNM